MQNKKLKIAFVVGIFPAVSETFIINQIADLEDRGFEVDVYSFKRNSEENVSERYFEYRMGQKARFMEMPESRPARLLSAIPKIFKILIFKPSVLFRIFNVKKFGRDALSMKILFWVEPWIGFEKKYDLIHCHFGTAANRFLTIRDILGLKQKFITTFYGLDVSSVFKNNPKNIYDKLKTECSRFIVMSENMKERVVGFGFDPENIDVLPISIEMDKYEFKERKLEPGEDVRMVTVGRFVEKKGYDDLLRALYIVKKKADKPFKCTVIGDGELKKEIYELSDKLDLGDVVDFKGFMKLEDVIDLFADMHLYLQPSKTAKNGDME